MTDGPTIDIAHLPAELCNQEHLDQDSRLLTLDEMQRNYIHRILAVAEGSKQKAAEILGISRSTLYKYLEPGGEP
jgi:transcriptional regulator of acetoin/glycerol metabolism